jgi:hypothetical protein
MYAVSGSLQAKVPEIEQVVPENESSLVNALLKRINFWKAAETAVSGFNYLTESQLSLTRNTDENGRLRGLALEMEDYSITGNKIK